MKVPQASVTHMSFEEFLAWASEEIRAEWVEGEVWVMAPVREIHALLQGWLFALFKFWLEFRPIGVVYGEGFPMRLSRSLRVPDLMVIRKEHQARIQEVYLNGPADLVVEIVSPESVKRDYVDKVTEYAQEGIPEYWILDPQNRTLTCFALHEQNRYTAFFEGGRGKCASQVLPGFWLQAEWLWERPLRPIHDVLKTIGGDEYQKWLQTA